MSSLDLDQESLMRLMTMNAAMDAQDMDSDFDIAEDDDDDDDDEAYGRFGDDDDEGFDSYSLDNDDDDDDDDDEVFDITDIADNISESRRGSRRSFKRRGYRKVSRASRKIGRIRGSKSTVLRSPNGQRLRVKFGKSYATSAEVNKLIKSTESRFKAALKERKLNYDRLTKQISKATSRIDSKVARMQKTVKALEAQGQTLPLLSLLGGDPKIKTIQLNRPNNADPTTEISPNEKLEATVEYEKKNMILPLLLGGGLGGGSGSNNNSLLLALAFSD
ncbi:MAG: hypothetical protein AAFQ21_15985, partial [Pseudomonadota bacterium]